MKNNRISSSVQIGIRATFLCALLGASLLFALPLSARADEVTARRGGGNALFNGATGIAHATSNSDILTHLTLASTRGGKPEEVPPAVSASNPPSNESDDTSTPDVTSEGADHQNGGASGGNGGSGGNSGVGGLVVAGGAVSNATALNVLNMNIVRISKR